MAKAGSAPEGDEQMTDADPIAAKGPRRYDLLGMGDEAFETMNARLIRLEFPAAFKPSNTKDGGADMVLPKDGGYERCWQSKHFSKNINWTQCKESLAAARNNWNPSHYTFCFWRELTDPEQKTFDKHFRGANMDILVDHWNGNEIQARLISSDQGQRVARTFFEDAELDRENVYRAIEAGGRLDTTEDAVDRLSNIGGFLASKDAYFSYPATTHEAGGPVPPVTPGAVMSYAKGGEEITSRVDVVPRDQEAMELYGPEFVLEPTEGAEGQRAAELLHRALSEGEPVAIEGGLDMTFTRMPPGLQDVVGKRMTGGRFEVGPAQRVPRPLPAWNAHLHVTTGQGRGSDRCRPDPDGGRTRRLGCSDGGPVRRPNRDGSRCAGAKTPARSDGIFGTPSISLQSVSICGH